LDLGVAIMSYQRIEAIMPQLLVRNVSQEIVEALKRRAAEHGRSVEAEHRFILEEALRRGRAGFWQRAAALREETRGRISVPSEDLIRQDRDER
jgi:antitoxin FitA